MITWAWKKPLHPAKSTAGRTTARRRCASTAVTMAPAIIARAIGYTAHAGARRRQIRSKGNIIAITAAGRTPPQMLLREPPCRSDKERHGHRYMAPCYGGCKSRNQSKSQKMSEFFEHHHISWASFACTCTKTAQMCCGISFSGNR